MFHKRLIILVSGLLFFSCFVQAQDSVVSSETVKRYKTESKQLLQYLEDTFNFLGDSAQPVSEKEIIINQSYIKIFRDDKVQIEDDLDENRQTPLNKDVQAYMKDIMFFFKTVRFHFEIQDIQQYVNDSGNIYFKITFNRNLKGITVKGDTVDNNRLRFMEINLNVAEKSLKIASIYTTKLNEKENARKWWNSLSPAWRNYFGRHILVYDTLPLAMILSFSDSAIVMPVWKAPVADTSQQKQEPDTLAVSDNPPFEKIPDTVKAKTGILYSLVQKLMKQETVDISNNLTIGNIQPLSELDNLRNLNMQNTLIDDLTPIHNLSKLEKMDVSGSPVNSLHPLRYVWNLKELDFSKTAVTSVEPLAGLTKLETVAGDSTRVNNLAPLRYHPFLKTLRFAGCNITTLDSLTNLPALNYLDLHGNRLTGIDSIAAFSMLGHLNLDNTPVSSIKPLSSLKNLTVLRINHTPVSDLSPLLELPALKIIYCDNSGVDRNAAVRFMKQKPECLVIYNSQKLENWWHSLPEAWKSAIKHEAGIQGEPTRITLHKLVHITRLDLSGISSINSLEPASMLYEIERLYIDNTSVSSLEPLSQIASLQVLSMNNTQVSGLVPLANSDQLKEIYMNHTPVSDLSPLSSCKQLKKVYCDDTKVTVESVSSLLESLPGVVVVFRSISLEMWWNNLGDDWQTVFRKAGRFTGSPSAEELHKLTQKTELTLKGLNLETGLEVLTPFFRLEKLVIDNCNFNDLSPLSDLKSLRSLTVTNGPLNNLSGIENMTQLDTLVLSNTGIDDIYLIENLTGLKTLDISGTRVSNLKPLRKLSSLKNLIINNTRVKTLKHIDGLKNLELLKCYNTLLRKKKVDAFKEKHPMTVVVYY